MFCLEHRGKPGDVEIDAVTVPPQLEMEKAFVR
jgi:hypothetical protein